MTDTHDIKKTPETWRDRVPARWFRRRGPLVTVVRLDGIIGRVGMMRRGLTMASVGPALHRAFAHRGIEAVALVINSPGGSAVQSARIADRVRALADEHDVPVYAFVDDVAASGGYWIAAAADEIHADAASIVGSIGVVSAGFGFPDLLRRLGIERRVYVAGDHKAGMDPFQRERLEDVEHLKGLQRDIYDRFCEHVRQRRGTRLNADETELFSGRFWSGQRALALGLIDGLGDPRSVLRERFGRRVRFRRVGDGRAWWRRRLKVPSVAETPDLGSDFAAGALAAVEERAIWSRFGL